MCRTPVVRDCRGVPAIGPDATWDSEGAQEPRSHPAVPTVRGRPGTQAGRGPPASVAYDGGQVGEAARGPSDHGKRPINLAASVDGPVGVLNLPHQARDAEKSARRALAEDFRRCLSNHVIYRLAHCRASLAAPFVAML